MAVAPPHRHPSRLITAILLLCIALTAAQSNQPASATNTSDYPQHVNDTDRIVLILTQPFNLQPLTNNAFDAVDHSPDANGSHPLGGGLADVFPGSTGNLSDHAADGPIAFISCDNSSYSGMLDMNRTLTDALAPGTNTTAILLYSTISSFCVLGSLPQQVADFGVIFTTTSASDAARLIQGLKIQSPTPGYIRATISSMAAWTNMVNAARNQMANNAFANPQPGTTVAMIILYSITGVIALLFVVIIITGAVRAHRHPERYGPRNVVGRPRQNRAVGIGRAMLETLPLVRFGETQPANKPADVEMNSVDGANATERRSSRDGREAGSTPAAEGEQPSTTTANSTTATATTTRADGAGKTAAAAQAMNHQEKVEMSLECAICWEDFEKGEEVRMLPCEHKFHPKCIDPWLLGFSGTCPVCRIEFGKKDKEDKSEEGASSAPGASSSQQ